MSKQTPIVPKHRSHRHTRSEALPNSIASSQSPLLPDKSAQASDTLRNMERTQHPTTPPRTPQKPRHNSTTTTTQRNQFSGPESVSKPRPRAKNRAKNPISSPAASRNDRNTPPLTAVQSGISSSIGQVSTPSAPAYAGPTFHASPAPSTLPLPSFLSKSVPDSPGILGLQSGTEETSSGGDESPTPLVANLVLTQPQREESPLDLFFKADREEKARARSASSFHASKTESGPFPPPHNSPRTSHNTPPPGSENINRATRFSGGSTSALFAMELDGTSNPSKPYGPAFSTPYHERINAARSPPASIEPTVPSSPEQPKSTEVSEALKVYLAVPTTESPTNPQLPRSPEDALGTPTRVAPSNSVPQWSNGNSTWPQHNNFSHLHNSGTSRHSPRAGSRSSGLRQELIATKPSKYASEQSELSNRVPPSLFRSAKHDQQLRSTNLPKSSSSISAPSQVSVSPAMQSGSQPTEVGQMEETLRRILKLEPVGNSTA